MHDRQVCLNYGFHGIKKPHKNWSGPFSRQAPMALDANAAPGI